ncbi:MAG: hypothetical protein ABJI96_07160 [Paracoccaceae bacterium]
MSVLVSKFRCALWASLFLLLLAFSVQSDTTPFNASQVAPNIAIVEVGDEGVTIDLEIFIGDVRTFADLLPARLFTVAEETTEDDEARLARFARDGISLRRSDGSILPISLKTVEPRIRVDRSSPLAGELDPLSGRPVPAPPNDPRVIFARLFYSFEGVKPDKIELLPPRDEKGVPVVIGTHVTDRGMPVSEFRFFAIPMLLKLDWEDPWYTRFRDSTLNRRSQSGTSAFLYVEPREIRVETLIRLRELAEWTGYEFTLNKFLNSNEQIDILTTAQEFLKTRNTLSIDDQVVQPSASRASILSLGQRGFEVLQDGSDTNSNAAFVGVILSYPIARLPQRAEVVWDMFAEANAEIPVIITDVASPFFSGVTEERPEILWTNQLLTYEDPIIESIPMGRDILRSQTLVYLVVAVLLCAAGLGFWILNWVFPIASAVLLCTGMVIGAIGIFRPSSLPTLVSIVPDQTGASGVLEGLVTQINKSTLEPTAENRARVLLPLVHEESLPDVSAEIERGIAIRLPGNGIARVTSLGGLKVETLTPLSEGNGFQVLAAWEITATGGHWGHAHTRAVEYRVLAELIADAGKWKISGITVLESQMSGG